MSSHQGAGPEEGLVISSPYGSPFGGGRFFFLTQGVPALGVNEDEEYFEYLFTLTPLGPQSSEDKCEVYTPVSIEITGDEQYYTMWICDSNTERCSVRNPSAAFKPGETVTSSEGGTAIVKDWHQFRESNALHIIEFEEGTATGNFPGGTITGDSSGATADCIAGWQDTSDSLDLGIDPISGLPNSIAVQPTIIGTLSGFYAYPKKVCYTKYLAPKCDTLLDVCGPIAEYPDSNPGWDKMFGEGSNVECAMTNFVSTVKDLHKDIWGSTEVACSRESTWPISVNTGVYRAEPLLGREATLTKEQTGDPLKLTNKKNVKLENDLKVAASNFFNTTACGFFESAKDFKEKVEALSEPANVEEHYYDIINNTVDTEEITDKKLEPAYQDSSEMYRKSKTYFCSVGTAFDYAIAATDFMDQVMNNVGTIVPSNSYIEIQQEWCTHSFRSVPPPGEKIKWSVFNYKPHRDGEKVFQYTITGTWVCTTATYLGDVTTETTDPETGETTTETTQQQLPNPNYGQTIVKTFNTNHTLESNWSTHRDNLKEVVENQGNPSGEVEVAEIKEFMNPSDEELIVFDYDAKEFPEYGYVELNNYEIVGRGISEMQAINIGYGYLNDPTVTFSEPDLENGTLPVVLPQVSAGRVVGFDIEKRGSGYVQEPEVYISAPDPVVTGTGDLIAGNKTIYNVTMDDYEKLFVGIRITSPGSGMSYNEVLRLVPGVAMSVTADGTTSIHIDEFSFDTTIDDVEAGMVIQGLDTAGLTISSIDLLTNTLVMSDVVAAGTYEINTAAAIQMIYPSDVSLSAADLVFTAPNTVTATARARLFLGNEGGSAYEYQDSREIAHYDGKELNEDGSVTLLNMMRGRKETEILQHLRNDHTFLHKYV